jgi:hypothetical protein
MTIAEARSILKEWNDFQEAILMRFCTTNLNRDVELYVSPTWIGRALRSDLEALWPVRITIQRCVRLEYQNELPEEQLGAETLWGLNEIAGMSVDENEEGLECVIHWGQFRRLSLVCHGIRADEAPGWESDNGLGLLFLDSSFYQPNDVRPE